MKVAEIFMKRRGIVYLFAFFLLASCKPLGELKAAFREGRDNFHTEFTQEPIDASAAGLLLHTSPCRLPCFAGLTPGVSSEADVEAFLQQFLISNKSAPTMYTGPDGYYGTSLFFLPAG